MNEDNTYYNENYEDNSADYAEELSLIFERQARRYGERSSEREAAE